MSGRIFYGSEETQNLLQRGVERTDISGNVNLIIMTEDDFNDPEKFQQMIMQARSGLGNFAPDPHFAEMVRAAFPDVSQDLLLPERSHDLYEAVMTGIYDAVDDNDQLIRNQPAFSLVMPFEQGTVGLIVVKDAEMEPEEWFFGLAGMDPDKLDFDFPPIPGNASTWAQLVVGHEAGHVAFRRTAGENALINMRNEVTADINALRSQFSVAAGIGPVAEAYMAGRALGSINQAPTLFESAEQTAHATNAEIDERGEPIMGSEADNILALAEIRTTAALFADTFPDLDEDESYIAGETNATDFRASVEAGEAEIRTDPQAMYNIVKAMRDAHVPPSPEAQRYIAEYLAAADKYLSQLAEPLEPEEQAEYNRGVQNMGAVYEDVAAYSRLVRPELLGTMDAVLSDAQFDTMREATVGANGPIMQ